MCFHIIYLFIYCCVYYIAIRSLFDTIILEGLKRKVTKKRKRKTAVHRDGTRDFNLNSRSSNELLREDAEMKTTTSYTFSKTRGDCLTASGTTLTRRRESETMASANYRDLNCIGLSFSLSWTKLIINRRKCALDSLANNCRTYNYRWLNAIWCKLCECVNHLLSILTITIKMRW